MSTHHPSSPLDSLISGIVTSTKTSLFDLFSTSIDQPLPEPSVASKLSTFSRYIIQLAYISIATITPISLRRSISNLSLRQCLLFLVGTSTLFYVFYPSISQFTESFLRIQPRRPRNDGRRKDDMMLIRRKKKAGKYTVGLLNPANDCFANSNLQALASLRILYGYISHLALIVPPDHNGTTENTTTANNSTPTAANNPSNSIKGGSKGIESAPLGLSISLGKTIVLLNEPILSPKSLSPWPFLHVLEKFYNSHISRNQHDAHELLHLILETLETEHERLRAYYASSKSASNVVIPDFPFQGTTIDRITCSKCGYSPTLSSSTFIVFSLMVPQQRSALLTDLLDEVSSPEFIKDYGCTKCRVSHVLQLNQDEKLISELNKYMSEGDQAAALSELPEELEARLPRSVTSPIAKSMQFGKLPKILTIHLSRSIYGGYGASRNSCKVTVTEFLELMEQQPTSRNGTKDRDAPNGMEITAKLLGNRTKVTYKLMAMIRHKGTHYAGHYECFRRKNLDWWIEHLPSFNADHTTLSSAKVDTPGSNSTQLPSPSSSDLSLNNGNENNKSKTQAEGLSNSTTQDNHGKLPYPQEHRSKVAAAKLDISSANHTQDAPSTGAAAAATTATGAPTSSVSSSSATPSPSPSPQPPTATSKFFGPEVAPPSHYEWWKISDDKTWECSTKDVLKEESGAYLLFYERQA